MKLIFERGEEGQGLSLMPKCDVPVTKVCEGVKRTQPLHLPHVSELQRIGQGGTRSQ